MAVSFQIDGATMPLDPEQVAWEPKDWIARTHGGAPLTNTKRRVRLRWEAMAQADFATLVGYCTSAAHSVKIPHPDTAVYTTFDVAYLQMANWSFKDVHVENVEIEASFITVT